MTSHSEIEDELSKAALLRELEEARIRECQMEKTVRWWTACTAGWRQKWSKVRHERDAFKRQANTSAAQLNSILNEIQQILDKPFSDESNSTLTLKLENILRKCRPKEVHTSPESLCEEINKPHDDEEVDVGAASDFNVPEMKQKAQHCSKAEKSEDCLIQRDKGKSVDVTASSRNKANRSSLTMEHEKNESLLEIMSDELESIASEKKRLHKDVENLKSKKIVLKQELRVSQLELDTLKEQLLILRDAPRSNEAAGPDLDKDRLLIENSTLRSQIRDLCYEICIAQEEIDKVSEQIIQLKEKNEEFLEHKMTCVKEIERLNLRLQLCGFYKEPVDSERL